MPTRSITRDNSKFARHGSKAVTYDLSERNVATITLPPHSVWTSGLHWHETHTEFLQVKKGRILVTLGHQTRTLQPQDGLVEVPRRTRHEWRRVPDDNSDEEVVVEEWTAPADGQKEWFFRMINSCLMEKEPQKMHGHLIWPISIFESWIERWTVLLQLSIIFKHYDNFPVLIGTDSGLLGWLVTHLALLLAHYAGHVLGLRAAYSEYMPGGPHEIEERHRSLHEKEY